MRRAAPPNPAEPSRQLNWGEIARRVLALRLAREPTRRTREKAAMPAPDTPLIGDALLSAVTDAMVAM
ncbi:MAG: hypothetical protein QOG59_1631, partial [Solirubrobacteraceae bacterium]|nr:hypothetical protein [Solirubrobacteraceae bacterium]